MTIDVTIMTCYYIGKGGDVMGKTNDRIRFTFRIPKDLDNYIKMKAEEWKSTKTATLIRILNEYSKQYPA